MGVIKGQCECHLYYFINYLFCSAASGILAIDEAKQPITLVLAEDGTIVDDEDYFLCLPADTKFVALAKNEKWSGRSLGTAWERGRGVWNTPRGMRLSRVGREWPVKPVALVSDSGAAQLSEAGDEVDSGAERWKQLARQLKDDLSSIILMSEEDLQVQEGNL